MDITAVPQTPDYVKGVINLRGQIVPVVDLRAKFGMESAETTRETAGIVVDHVQEVLDIPAENIEETPQFGPAVRTDFILGMAKVGESVKILLDIDKALAGTDLASVGEAAQQAAAE